jgi:PAS domain S-box-containing protein
MDRTHTSDQYIKISDSSGKEIDIPFNYLIESVNEGIYCVNTNGQVVYANQRFCKNLGYTVDEVIGQDIFNLLYSPENIALAKTKLELRKKGVSDSYDIQVKTRSGLPIWARMNGKPLTNENGEFVGAVVVSTVITQQRELEQQLIDAKEHLEAKVITRTRQLSEANQKLSEQIKERRMADISLKNSEKRFRDIYLNSPDAIYIESMEGVILDVNDATCRLHQQPKENLIGKTIYQISPPQSYNIIRERQPKIVKGEITKFESECLTREGSILPIEVSVATIEFKEKPALLMHVRDISDRKRNEILLQTLNSELEAKVKERTRELQEMNEKMQREIKEKEDIELELQRQKDFLRLIIDSTPNLIFVKDQNGKFLLANKATATFYGMETEQMEGHFDTEQNFNAEELAEFKEQDEEVLKAGHEVQFPEQSFLNPDTDEVVWVQTVKKPIPSITGDEINILGVGTDITAIKEAKEDLKLSEQLYREIARNLPKAAMFIFDKELKFLLAEGPLVGIISKKKNEIEGKTVFETIRESERDRAEKIYRGILAGESSESEQEFFGRQLKVYHIPIRNDAGKVIYGMVMVFDISDLKQVQTELEKRATLLQRSNEELERFAYVASHDLQGPLRTIASYLQLLEMRYKNKLDDEALEFIDFSVTGAKRMQTLILDLLNYSRISSAPKPFVKTNTTSLVKDVVKGLESSVKNSMAEIIINKLPEIVAEPNQLYQLFQNLIDNGLKFVKDKAPVITISCTEHEHEYEFTVADNGIGIKQEFKEKVFQIFQRLHAVTDYPGTGVGLAICKKIVLLHGGRIWFNSEPDKGTTFHFTIRKNLENE